MLHDGKQQPNFWRLEMRWLGGLFLVAHGLLHVAVWVPRPPANVPFDTSRSPMFGNVRGIAISLSLLAALLFVVAGVAVLIHAAWWAPVAIAAAAISVLLIILTFSPWLLAGLAIDVVIFVLALLALRKQ
jgi:hypothetical protein